MCTSVQSKNAWEDGGGGGGGAGLKRAKKY